MTILLRDSKPENFESRNPLKLRFSNTGGDPLFGFAGFESFLETDCSNIFFYLCETISEDSASVS